MILAPGAEANGTELRSMLSVLAWFLGFGSGASTAPTLAARAGIKT
jgi:hypothetical protein